MTKLTALPDAEAVAIRAAEEIERRLADAVKRRGRAHLALSGGTTPRLTYQLLGERLAHLNGIEIWFADERCVPPEDEQSNYRLAAETLLRGVSPPPADVHRMRGELGPEQGAARYIEELRAASCEAQDGVPILDVIVLGIGPDGHVASLFPGADTLQADPQAICLPVHDSPKPPPQRITLSLSVLRAARSCILLATGAGKADAISAAVAEPTNHVPASLLCRQRLTAIVDDLAAPQA